MKRGPFDKLRVSGWGWVKIKDEGQGWGIKTKSPLLREVGTEGEGAIKRAG
jgi:hypothetical protein